MATSNNHNHPIRNDLKNLWCRFRQMYDKGDALTRIAYIDVLIFLLVTLCGALLRLMGTGFPGMQWVALPATFTTFLTRPWTLITYQFLHDGLLHILFNVLALLWINRLLKEYFSGRQTLTLFLLGVIIGGAVFEIGYNLLPQLMPMRHGVYLVGASAGILALIGAMMVYDPYRYLYFPVIGEMRIVYVCLILLFFTFVGGLESNVGGTLAHAGGLVTGLLWGIGKKQHRSNFLTTLENKLDGFIERISSDFRKNTGRSQAGNKDNEPLKKKRDPQMESILDKLRKSGYEGLSEEEKRQLFRQS